MWLEKSTKYKCAHSTNRIYSILFVECAYNILRVPMQLQVASNILMFLQKLSETSKTSTLDDLPPTQRVPQTSGSHTRLLTMYNTVSAARFDLV